ncbi:sigma-70 family RNA polymerase sigma factor [Isoptericola sp. S6320L]|uniref:RNA polymerase sigma factor n=1 Tax=Isoptericola sp. S6320L TaxID=2926411 RepID=UPI001FF37E16|nr:sigma-70 family RNA polymerase sigma factor [Isoptericola sp. S6320L]MCK0116691.1 sigma-70 family RNA polymerase sigma factor [Isoptericola sp. S6320L]
MRPDATDPELWARVRADDQHAFSLLFRRYHERVLRTAAARLRGVARADPGGVAADVFAILWRRRASVRVETTVWPWLRGVASRLCANERRRCLRQDRLVVHAASTASADVHVVPDHAPGVADRLALVDALARLGPVESQVAHLALVDDLPEAEVAAALRVPVGTVKSRLHRARRELRHHLQRHGSVGP